MSEKRYLRLCALALVIAGGGGTALTLTTSLFAPTDGTAIFPAAALLGVIILMKLRPRTNRKDNTK